MPHGGPKSWERDNRQIVLAHYFFCQFPWASWIHQPACACSTQFRAKLLVIFATDSSGKLLALAISRGNVIDMLVGVVIGAALGKSIGTLVEHIK